MTIEWAAIRRLDFVEAEIGRVSCDKVSPVRGEG
jgi:hypothetical protein